MNDDLISRQAAIDFVDAGHLVNPNEPRWSDNEVVNFLKRLPTIDPVKHGRWEYIEDKYIDVCKCSECGTVEYFNKGWKKFNFCPNCGARMEE